MSAESASGRVLAPRRLTPEVEPAVNRQRRRLATGSSNENVPQQRLNLDGLAIGAPLTAAFVGVIGWAGLLTAISTLATHFVLLRAPLTADLSSWRAPTTYIFLGVVLALGVGGCYVAANPPRDPHASI